MSYRVKVFEAEDATEQNVNKFLKENVEDLKEIHCQEYYILIEFKPLPNPPNPDFKQIFSIIDTKNYLDVTPS